MHVKFTYEYISNSNSQVNTFQINKEMHFKFTMKYNSNSQGNAFQIHK